MKASRPLICACGFNTMNVRRALDHAAKCDAAINVLAERVGVCIIHGAMHWDDTKHEWYCPDCEKMGRVPNHDYGL